MTLSGCASAHDPIELAAWPNKPDGTRRLLRPADRRTTSVRLAPCSSCPAPLGQAKTRSQSVTGKGRAGLALSTALG